jgi:hypothetical protein
MMIIIIFIRELSKKIIFIRELSKKIIFIRKLFMLSLRGVRGAGWLFKPRDKKCMWYGWFLKSHPNQIGK